MPQFLSIARTSLPFLQHFLHVPCSCGSICRTEAFGLDGAKLSCSLLPRPCIPSQGGKPGSAVQSRAPILPQHSGEICSPDTVSFIRTNPPSFSPQPSAAPLPLQHSRQCCLFTSLHAGFQAQTRGMTTTFWLFFLFNKITIF